MNFRTGLGNLSLTKALSLSAVLLASAIALPAEAANPKLPAPYVSRALDAVLLPIDADVTAAFSLAADETGVLVLAVQPGGVAEAAGIAPGDVISVVNKHRIASPIELDEVVYYWITQGAFDFIFDGWRTGASYSGTSTITQDSYLAAIELTTIETWSSWSYESFSYSEYTSAYSEEITASYESSETTIEESVTSEEFTSEMTSEESSEEAADADTDHDGVADAEDTDDDGVEDAQDNDDDGVGIDDAADTDDGGDDAGGDDGGDEGGE